jgi:hypothetical protein
MCLNCLNLFVLFNYATIQFAHFAPELFGPSLPYIYCDNLLDNSLTRVIVNCGLCAVATVFLPDRMAAHGTTQLTHYFCWPNIFSAIFSVRVGDSMVKL